MNCQKLFPLRNVVKVFRNKKILGTRYGHQKRSPFYKQTGLDSAVQGNVKFCFRSMATECATSSDIFREGLVDLRLNYPSIVNNLTNFELYEGLPGLKERFTEMLNYTVDLEELHLSSSLTMLYFYKMLENPTKITPETVKLACVIAWCIKLFEVSLIVTDDIIDNSILRYGKLSWFKRNDVGVNDAILDSYFLEYEAYHLVQKYLKAHPQFANITHLLQNEFFKIIIGQYVSSRRLPLDEFESSYRFSLERATICFSNPVRTAMYLANIDDSEMHRQAADFCTEMGHYFCIQNDYMDVFGDKSRKDMTDIQLGKCTWLAAYAWRKSNVAQRKLMEEHFGKKDKDSDQKIVDLFQEMNLNAEYERLSKQFHDKMSKNIQNMPKDLNKEPFYYLLNKLFLYKWWI